MKSNIPVIMKKELFRFFTDRRMLITTLILPGLMIYIIYTFLGSALNSDKTQTRYRVQIANEPASVQAIIGKLNFDISNVGEEVSDTAMASLKNNQIELFVRFPADFDNAVAAYSPASGTAAPNVGVFYNSASQSSSYAYSAFVSVLDQYESSLANKFDINNPGASASSGDSAQYDAATKQESSGRYLAMLLPMLIMSMLFSGCMAVAPESIAGEKERGTIATLLVTPLRRRELAIGKITSLSLIALLSGLSSFIGIMLSLPKMIGMDISASFYSAVDYVMLLLVIFSTILVIVSLISIISAYAKTVKEATTSIAPLMILCILVGVTPMLGTGAPKLFAWYLIPVYNSVQSINAVLSFQYTMTDIAVTLAANVLVTALMIVLLAKMFNNEKIMFKR